MTYRIGLITDTHVSHDRPYFNENFETVAQAIRDMHPDLVLNMGDVTLDGADSREDLLVAKQYHDGLGVPWVAIPGNHDVGDNQETGKPQVITAERRARWREIMGPDYWLRDVPGWRLLGIDCLLLGSDLREAPQQEAFISEAAATLGVRQLALFLHKPLYYDTLDDAEISTHGVNPAPRKQLLRALGGVVPRLVCSGHRHEYRERDAHGMHQIWAPAGSFTLSDWFMPTRGGVHVVGFVALALEADGTFTSELVRPPRIVDHDLVDFPGAYGDLRKRAPHAAS